MLYSVAGYRTPLRLVKLLLMVRETEKGMVTYTGLVVSNYSIQ